MCRFLFNFIRFFLNFLLYWLLISIEFHCYCKLICFGFLLRKRPKEVSGFRDNRKNICKLKAVFHSLATYWFLLLSEVSNGSRKFDPNIIVLQPTNFLNYSGNQWLKLNYSCKRENTEKYIDLIAPWDTNISNLNLTPL